MATFTPKDKVRGNLPLPEKTVEERGEVSFKELCGFQPKQLEATRMSDLYQYFLYGGTRGPGKSYWLRWHMLRLLLKLAGEGIRYATVGLFCEDYPSLTERQTNKIAAEFPEWLGRLRDTKNKGFGFHLNPTYGGGFLALRNLDDPSKYQSAEFAAMGIDEITKNEEKTFDILRGSLRWRGVKKPRFVAATNPGGVGHCFKQGNVLTKRGWIDIKEVKLNDYVATVNDDDELVYDRVTQLHQYYFDGYLKQLDNAANFIECTPDHRIAYRTETKSKYGRKIHKKIKLKKIKDLSKTTRVIRSASFYNGKRINKFKLPITKVFRKCKHKQPMAVDGSDYCEFMGWYLSEGFDNSRDKAFGIAQSKKENREKIESLLNKMGFIYSNDEDQFIIYSPYWYEYLKQFGKCRDKFVPDIILNADKEQLNLFLSAAILGDGYESHYYTSSKQLAYNMLEIGLKLGKSPRLTSRQRENRAGLSYDVNFRIGRNALVEKKQIKDVPYTGNTYCIGTEKYHRFFVEQNGCIWLSGNSWVKRLWIDRDFPERYQKLKDEFYFLAALPDDNKYLDESYWDMLESLPAGLKAAWRYGEWDVFEGQFFSEFRRDKHVVHNYEIVPEFTTIGGLDYGNITALEILQMDYEGTVIAADECYLPDATNPTERANAIADFLIERGLFNIRIIYDTDMEISQISNVGFDKTPIQIFMQVFKERMGKQRPSMICVTKKSVDRDKSYRQACNEAVKNYMNTKNDAVPKLYFSTKVKQLLYEITEKIIYDEKDPDSLDFLNRGVAKPHAFDALKYAFMELQKPYEKKQKKQIISPRQYASGSTKGGITDFSVL